MGQVKAGGMAFKSLLDDGNIWGVVGDTAIAWGRRRFYGIVGLPQVNGLCRCWKKKQEIFIRRVSDPVHARQVGTARRD